MVMRLLVEKDKGPVPRVDRLLEVAGERSDRILEVEAGLCDGSPLQAVRVPQNHILIATMKLFIGRDRRSMSGGS